jgi:hypothetical protein
LKEVDPAATVEKALRQINQYPTELVLVQYTTESVAVQCCRRATVIAITITGIQSTCSFYRPQTANNDRRNPAITTGCDLAHLPEACQSKCMNPFR